MPTVETLPRGIRLSPRVVTNTIPYPAAAPATTQLPGNIDVSAPTAGLLVRLRYRAHVTVAATSVLPGGPLGLAAIRIEGTHKRKGKIIIADVPLWKEDARNRITLGCSAFNIGTSLAVGVGTYDVDVTTFVPTSLVLQLSHQVQQAMSLLMPDDWPTGLSVFGTWGASADIYQGGTVAIEGFGGVGVAQMSFEVLEADLGGVPVLPFIVRRVDSLLPASATAVTGVNQQVVPQLDLGVIYYDILVSTFIPNAGSTLNVPLTLQDGTVASKLYLLADTKTKLVEVEWPAQQYFEENISKNAVTHEAGHVLLDFGRGDLNAALDVTEWGIKPRRPKRLSFNADLTQVANAQLSYLTTILESGL